MISATTSSVPASTAIRRPIEATSLKRDLDRATSLTQPAETTDEKGVKEQFQSILGELLFGQMLKSMRQTVGKAAYFDGGRTEEVFTQQLDQVLTQKLGRTAAEPLVGPMYDLFMLQRQ